MATVVKVTKLQYFSCYLGSTSQRGMAHFVRVNFALLGYILELWLATVARGNFYKVDCLAVATRISHNYQVLLE